MWNNCGWISEHLLILARTPSVPNYKTIFYTVKNGLTFLDGGSIFNELVYHCQMKNGWLPVKSFSDKSQDLLLMYQDCREPATASVSACSTSHI